MKQAQPPEISRLTALRQNCLPVVWVVCIGVGFSLTLFFTIRSWERRSIVKAFHEAADDRSEAVKNAFETELAMLELVRSSLISDGRIEREEFREILVPFLSRTHDIQAVEWVPRVPDSRRAQVEAAARRDGVEGFRITELDKNGKIVAAPRRNEYFPVYFIGPQVGNTAIFGYDVASEPTRFESLKLACDTNRIVASGRIALVQDANSAGGFLVYLPVYEKDKSVETIADRQKNLMGYILGVFRPTDMIESALAKFQPEGIDVGLYDPSDVASKRTFHVHASRVREGGESSADRDILLDPTGVRHLVKLGVAGHPWTIVCTPTPEFGAAHRTWWPGGVLAIGLVFTAMLAGYLLQSIDYTLHLEERVRTQTTDVRRAHEEVLIRLASASQYRDQETGMHIRRTGLLSQALARAAGWLGDELEAIRQAAPMHDIGKIGILDAVLRKPGKLTPQEFEVMKTHTLIGSEILAGSKVPMLQMAREIALNHHERWDGKGYPRGLAGKDIPESARIVAIVDVYDALTHDRVNRPALPEDEVLAIMHQGEGKQFDPELLAEFFRHLPEMRRLVEQHPDNSRSDRRPASAAAFAAASPAAPAPGLPLASQPSVWPSQLTVDPSTATPLSG